MMFPTANSSIIRNEDGEVLGWDSPSYGEMDWEGDIPEYEESDWAEGDEDPATCEHGDRDMKDRRTGSMVLEEMPTREALYWECMRCGTEIDLTDEEFESHMND